MNFMLWIFSLAINAGFVAMIVIGSLSISNTWVELGHAQIDIGGAIAMLVIGSCSMATWIFQKGKEK